MISTFKLAKYVGAHGKKILKQLPWSGNHSVYGNNVNRFPPVGSSPGGAVLLGLLLFGTMSNLMGPAPRPPSPPNAPATNFTVQQVCLNINVYFNNL